MPLFVPNGDGAEGRMWGKVYAFVAEVGDRFAEERVFFFIIEFKFRCLFL